MNPRKLILAILLGLASFSAIADSGPYYLSTNGYCNIRKFYLDVDGFVYGKEVGCTDTGDWTFGGFYEGGRTFSVTRISSNNSTGSPSGLLVTNLYDLYSDSMVLFESDGSFVYPKGYYTYAFSTFRPSGAFASLPNHDNERHEDRKR